MALKLRLDPDVVKAFRATGPGWQTMINETLRLAVLGRLKRLRSHHPDLQKWVDLLYHPKLAKHRRRERASTTTRSRKRA